MDEYKLTAVVPVYNAEKYLKSCLKSLAAQTLGSIEVIIIDDGSTDKSADIAQYFEDTYSHFKLVKQQNSGRSAARNKGLNLAKGSYISFVDADDFLDPQMYEKLFTAAVEQESKEVRCGFVQFEDKTGRILKHRREFGIFTEINSTENLLKAYFENTIERVVWNGIYHRSLFETVCFPTGKEYEDQYVTPQLLVQTNKYIYLPYNYYYYRKHPEAFSNTESTSASAMADKVQSLNMLYELIEDSKLKKELSYQYSRYFYFEIFNYHKPSIYRYHHRYQGYLQKNRKSIDSLIISEAFEFVLEQNHLDRRERFFMRLMRQSRSHFLLYPVQMLFRVWDLIFRADNSPDIHGQRVEIYTTDNNQRYRKMIELYG